MSAAGVSAGKMEQKDLDYFKALLDKWLQDLLNQIDRYLNEFNPIPTQLTAIKYSAEIEKCL